MNDASWWEMAKLIIGGGGGVGLIGWLVAIAAKRSAENVARTATAVDLRKITDAASAALIADLQRHRQDCETRLAVMETRVEVLERIIPVMRMRDNIMAGAITDAGLKMPRLPPIRWPDGDGK